MPIKVCLIESDQPEGDRLRSVLKTAFTTTVLKLEEFIGADRFDAVVLDLQLTRADDVKKLQYSMSRFDLSSKTIGYMEKGDRRQELQMKTLNIGAILVKPVQELALFSCIADLLGRPLSEIEPKAFTPEDTVENLGKSIGKMFTSVRTGRELSREAVDESASLIIRSVKEHSIDTWLDEIRQHHSHTYRHCMLVTLLATAFGIAHNMEHNDVRRLTIGSLMHDVGKAFVPLEILDKPARLTNGEMALVKMHPVEGERILKKSGLFDDEVLKIARSHHEKLDGSGYPDGLVAYEIDDIVRIVTVVDIFAALVETRSYKEPHSFKDALKILRDMGNQLDQDIVELFAVVALKSDMKKRVANITKAKIPA